VRVASFRANVSGDLLTIVGEAYFVDAGKFIDKAKPAPKPMVAAASAPEPRAPPNPIPFQPLPLPALPPGATPARLDSDYGSPQAGYENAVAIMLTHFGDKREVWMTPYLNKLRQEMPQLAESERKALIGRMVDQGVVRVEKRKGQQYDYSVLVINWNHPDVQRHNA
jgi:hypothetical protein